jgi:methylmalonyl-CoA mutase
MTELGLGAEFPTPKREEWLAAVEKVLRGRPFDKVLVSTTRDGLDIQPLYGGGRVEAGSLVDPDPERLDRGWDVRQVHDGADPDCASGVLAELERGVTSIEITAPADGWTLDSLRGATEGVLLDLAPVALAPHARPDDARALHSLIVERGDGDTTASWLGLDPLGEISRGGTADLSACAAVAAELAPSLPQGRTLTVDSTRYGDAGATEAEELGWGLATGVAYLRAMEVAGVPPSGAAATISFRMTAGADQFMTIASLRAARRLWRRVLDACDVPADGPRHLIQAVTGRSMFSRRDPWVNMLRGTTAAMAAGLGGADAVTVLPFDDALGEPDGFSQRVARNTQLLLIEESHLAQVVDPAAGSWFVESLTDRLAESAWKVFQDVEASGGIESALADGTIRAALDQAWDDRVASLGTRRVPITGVSEFPDVDESPVERPPRDEPAGFPVRRLAAPFEALRDAADRALASSGERPSVHLAALGDLATHTARSTWITNFLAVGGVVATGGDVDGSASPLEAEARFVESGASVAVICSSDGVYAERAAATATALKEAGAARVVLAGAPGEMRDELTGAGVDEFWHVGVDVLEALTRIHADLGI